MYIVNIESCFSKCFFDEGLTKAEGYDEYVQGLTIHQLRLMNGISEPVTYCPKFNEKIKQPPALDVSHAQSSYPPPIQSA